MKSALATLAVATIAWNLAGCSGMQQAASHATDHVRNASSPVVGAWHVEGEPPPPGEGLPVFVRLEFAPDGTLEASYFARGGVLAKIVSAQPATKIEHDRYVLGDGGRLTIVEGSRSLEYTVEVHDETLSLTPSGSSSATIFQKV